MTTKEIDWTKPIQFRSYVAEVSFIGSFLGSFFVKYERSDSSWRALTFDSIGKCFENHGYEYDIINVPEEPKKYFRYVNFYDNSERYETRANADYEASTIEKHSLCGNKRIACVRVEFTEGQFDE